MVDDSAQQPPSPPPPYVGQRSQFFNSDAIVQLSKSPNLSNDSRTDSSETSIWLKKWLFVLCFFSLKKSKIVFYQTEIYVLRYIAIWLFELKYRIIFFYNFFFIVVLNKTRKVHTAPGFYYLKHKTCFSIYAICMLITDEYLFINYILKLFAIFVGFWTDLDELQCAGVYFIEISEHDSGHQFWQKQLEQHNLLNATPLLLVNFFRFFH